MRCPRNEPDSRTQGILEKGGYFESALPWAFPEIAIELRRFLKIGEEEDKMMIDVLLARSEEVRRIIRNGVEAESEEGRVMLTTKNDLIWLKSARGSKQDHADIEKLKDDEDR